VFNRNLLPGCGGNTMDGKLGSDETWHMVRLTFHGPGESRMQVARDGSAASQWLDRMLPWIWGLQGPSPCPLAPAGNGQRHCCCRDTSENPLPYLQHCKFLCQPVKRFSANRARRIPQTQQKLPLHVRSRLPLSKRRLPQSPKRSQSSLIWQHHDCPRPL